MSDQDENEQIVRNFLMGAAHTQAALRRRRVILFVDESMLTEHGYEPVFVAEGETGCYRQGRENHQQPWYFGHDFKVAKRLVDEANERLGVSPEEAHHIVMASMFPGYRP
ncbi:hypothetical protein [Micromonospora sp. NPDC047730]|uniref:hypothetical protein n=1 Tax=Micromonospora sp. NPDC047730 TaxID=3364253 RepID=UPI00371413FA